MIAGGKISPQKYIAVQEWVETRDAIPYFSTYFDPAITDFYGWTIPRGEMTLVGAALPPRKDIAGKFEKMKRGLTRHGLQLGKTLAREGAVINRPVRLSQIYTGAGGVALLGEAAGWISPSSAEGFSYAGKLGPAATLNQNPNFKTAYRKALLTAAFFIFFAASAWAGLVASHFIFDPPGFGRVQ